MSSTPQQRRYTDYDDSPVPRMPARFPQTPPSSQAYRLPERRPMSDRKPTIAPTSNAEIINNKAHAVAKTGPWIPVTVLDPAQQRLYAAAAFGLLQAYKLYDLGKLYSEDDDSMSELWFILKWLLIDGLYAKWLPLLRIPWLTFSTRATVFQILIMGMFNIFFSLKYQVSIQLLLLSMWKKVYDRELAISERRVKVNDIVFNSSHILGKHTLHFLPEGSAKINPDNSYFCIDHDAKYPLVIPIRINSTLPSLIQISRINFENSELDTYNLTQKEVKKLIKTAPRGSDPKIHHLQYSVKIPGLYRLKRVVDVSNLVVRIYRSEALVVECPSAHFDAAGPGDVTSDRCKGDLSDMSLRISGLPPLQVKYSRTINKDEKGVTVESVSPENYESPLIRGIKTGGQFTLHGDRKDMEWAQTQKIKISLNESLALPGGWFYTINEVRDGLGNIVTYPQDFEMPRTTPGRSVNLRRAFDVHDRPQAKFTNCDPQNPQMVRKNEPGVLPVDITGDVGSPPYDLVYDFTPSTSIKGSTEHGANANSVGVSMSSASELPAGKEPGLYTLRSISSKFCVGEILESSSCLLLTPPDPSLAITVDEILDKCAGFSIGLTVDLTLVGTPPFMIRYRMTMDKDDSIVRSVRVDGTRHQLRLTPIAEGHYTYEFFSLDDRVYRNVGLNAKELRADQRVVPAASASFLKPNPNKKCCIEESASFELLMRGSSPWTLNYELIHAGKRTKYTERNITKTIHVIHTPKLLNGGQYTLALGTVEDSFGCKIFLESEARIDVRRQRPKASFGEIEGKRFTKALEGAPVRIPLRLVGEKPFIVKIRHLDIDQPPKLDELTISDHNDFIEVKNQGQYEIMQIKDLNCPGTVNEAASIFNVEWISKPSIKLAESSAIEEKGERHIRNAVCEGNEDAVEFLFSGSPPFKALYDQSYQGQKFDHKYLRSQQELKAGINVANVRMDTSRSGDYFYKFISVSDNLYDTQKLRSPLYLEQKVYPRPAARFQTPGKTYKYCLEAGAGDDVIPMVLEGFPPWKIDLSIKHYATGKSESFTVENAAAHDYKLRVPAEALTLGGHAISINTITDAKGCVKRMIDDTTHVIVAVADLPLITALDNKAYYCVGDRISFSLAGVPPFIIEYNFEGKHEKASTPATFQRIAERPGTFTITSLKDSASDCKVTVDETRLIYDIPSVRVSEGAQIVEGIHEGDQAEIHFTFVGDPPFTFTYTRSELARKGQRAKVLEMHTQTTDSYVYSISASQEGTYEVISIQDQYCGFSARGVIEDNIKLLKNS